MFDLYSRLASNKLDDRYGDTGTAIIEFCYGDKRRDKATVRGILRSQDEDYDPAKDRYKRFRDAMTSLEEGGISLERFKTFYTEVSANKTSGYKLLCTNYLEMKEDYGLIWQGRSPLVAELADLRIEPLGICVRKQTIR